MDKDILGILVTEEEIHTKVAELGAKITADFAGKDVIDVTENVESYICALSGTNAATDPLTLSDYYSYKKDILGITSAFIGDHSL